MTQIKLPKFLHRYFWDNDNEKLQTQNDQKYIIERILDLGDEKAIKWLFDNYDRQTISQIVLDNRQLSKKSLNYWLTILNLEKWKPKLLAGKQKAIWNY